MINLHNVSNILSKLQQIAEPEVCLKMWYVNFKDINIRWYFDQYFVSPELLKVLESNHQFFFLEKLILNDKITLSQNILF